MAKNVLVDTGFLVGLLRKRDERQRWAAIQATTFPPPWLTCEAVLSEAYHLLEEATVFGISAMLRRGALTVNFELSAHLEPVLSLVEKYADVPMALADACLVRMAEILDDPIVLTTDEHFRVYRRHSRRVVPCVLPD
jgi:predicted nucleic acid-binding protein